MLRFAGIALNSERIPYETAILAFRYFLEKNDFGRQVLEEVKAHLNVTIIGVPSSTKNEKKGRDLEMPQNKRGD